ncbi:hypothetical protein DJ66_0614 [Candidatus Liberibacter solanacearum]|uniref:Uncharacterized protein n=1 Tax=Candidatus Liberibacter solanacearum TaxID=556287 RepID=A0A0F4VK78_9HYPH|nr:hypothetical protein [Candidatus Liberibacter solanacearum]KJZ81886.1 hypothetical protein DJ66_0614 [Candidatus Liberibacter solanacearum]
MADVAEKEKSQKTSSQPITEYRLTLLEKNYARLENIEKLIPQNNNLSYP